MDLKKQHQKSCAVWKAEQSGIADPEGDWARVLRNQFCGWKESAVRFVKSPDCIRLEPQQRSERRKTGSNSKGSEGTQAGTPWVRSSLALPLTRSVHHCPGTAGGAAANSAHVQPCANDFPLESCRCLAQRFLGVYELPIPQVCSQ